MYVDGFVPTVARVGKTSRWCGFFVTTQPDGASTIEAVASGRLLRVHADAERSVFWIAPSARRDALTLFRVHALEGSCFAIESATVRGHYMHANGADLVLRPAPDARVLPDAGRFAITERT